MRRRRLIVAPMLLLFAAASGWWEWSAWRDDELRRRLVGTWEAQGAPPIGGVPWRVTYRADGWYIPPAFSYRWRVSGGVIVMSWSGCFGVENVCRERARFDGPDAMEMEMQPLPPASALEWVVRCLRPPPP